MLDVVGLSAGKPDYNGHVQRKAGGKRMLRLRLPLRRPADVGKEDLRVLGVSEEDAEDRIRWRGIIYCCDPRREQPLKEEV